MSTPGKVEEDRIAPCAFLFRRGRIARLRRAFHARMALAEVGASRSARWMLGSLASRFRYELPMRSCRRIPLLLALACQVGFAVVPPTGLLLCLGADGHFDVETPHAGRACHTRPGESAKADCRDIAISPSQIVEQRNVQSSDLRAPTSAPVTLSPPPAPSGFAQILPACTSLRVPDREARRTVVLLV